MRTLVILFLFGCFMVGATGRPSRFDEGNESGGEVEYDNAEDENIADDSIREEVSMNNDNEQSASDQEIEEYQNNEAAENDQVQDLGPNADLRHAAIEKQQTDNFPEYKTCKSDARYGADSPQSDKVYQPVISSRQSSYHESNDAKTSDNIRLSQHLNYEDFTNSKLDASDNVESNKKLVGSRSVLNDINDLVPKSPSKHSKDNKSALRGYNNNGLGDSSDQAQYFKQYYNTLQANRDEKNYGNIHNSINRDRRQTQDNGQKDLLSIPAESETLDNNTEEEAAIKRHVKKLSRDELEELMGSLSQDKRELLKKIIDSDIENNSDIINKREITKKAGAAENSLDSLTDSSKLQSGSSLDDTNTGTPLNTGSTVSSKQTPNEPSDLPATKVNDVSSVSAISDIILDLTNSGDILSSLNQLDGSTSLPVSDVNNQVNLDSNLQVTSKTETKRETNLEDMADLDLSSFEEQSRDQALNGGSQDFPKDNNAYVCSQDDDLSQLTEEEFNLHNDENIFKREANTENNADLLQSIKSLEESFPNLNSYDESNPYSGSDMAPHVRVKRKNEDLVVKKRAAALLPDAKVAYVPYRAENDDEDNDEGNEFDDEGFYDRTSSLTKNQANAKTLDDASNRGSERPLQVPKARMSQEMSNSLKLSNAENIEMEVSDLGSDTDSVLSGVEGVDENLMFSSGSRNRRMDNEKSDSEANINEVEENHPVRSTPLLVDEMKSPSGIYLNAPKYEESDAFGPLPRSYEGELGRYKRIRRVKQAPTSQETANLD